MGIDRRIIRKWYGCWLIFCMVWLVACQPAPAQTQPTKVETQPPVELTRPAGPTTMAATVDHPTVEVCEEIGQVRRFKLDSELMNGDQYLSVYLPPCYDETLAGGYPVLYLLHGQTFDDGMWLDLGAGMAADELIASGESRPFLMVFPYEEFYYRNPDRTNFPKAFMEEVIPFVESSFNVCTDRACRALGGISRGASWTARLGFVYRDQFAAIGMHSLPTFAGDLDDLPVWLEDIPDDGAPLIYMDIGRFDPEIKTAYKFELVLNEKGILHEWHLNDGRHNTEYWTVHIGEYMRWYASVWDALAQK